MDRRRRQLHRILGFAVLVFAGLLIVVLAGQGGTAAASRTGQTPRASARRAEYLGAHSALYLDTPFSAKKTLFAQAAAVGASYIRLDIELSAVFPGPGQDLLGTVGYMLEQLGRSGGHDLPVGAPDWSGLDQYMRLARRYHLHVLGDLLATPDYMANCPPHTPMRQWYRCPPRNPNRWGHDAGEIAAHTRGVINDFEIINEPDARQAFLGTPQQYARVLSASYRAIHTAAPTARVLLGGLRHIGSHGRRWMNDVLATPGAHALHSFDVANIHVRVPPAQAGGVVCGWRGYFKQKRFTGPLWVTETGYPANPAEQRDPGYEDGSPAQARWLAEVIPAMLRAGAEKVFVAERDSSRGGPFASEGVLHTAPKLTADPRFSRRQSFYSVQRQAEEGAGPMMSDYLHSLTGRKTSQWPAGAGC